MHTFTNWLSQVGAISLFCLRSIPDRLGASLAASVGIAGVVLVLVGVLAIAEGFRRAMTVSGVPDVAIVLRSGADSEMTSGLSRDEVRVIRDAPGVKRTAEGSLCSAELFVIIDLPKRSTQTSANVPLRGIESTAYEVRGNIQMVQGRRFEPGKNEVIVGAGAANAFIGLDLNQELRVGQSTWKVVGIFTAGGGIAESEIWCDAAVLQPAYHREDNYQSVYARLVSPEAFQEFKDAVTTNPQLKTKVARLSEFYAEQSTAVTDFITSIGVFIAVMMALGASFGALNTMYGAVSSRTREIATLRAIGFNAGPVVISVLAESLVLALAGGTAGALAAYLAFDGYRAATINWQTFSQVTFTFSVTPQLFASAIACASIIGLIGGALPAIRAARLPIAAALRET
ncbi:MAG: ABC transporter permease [Roseimicrobium sp.]